MASKVLMPTSTSFSASTTSSSSSRARTSLLPSTSSSSTSLPSALRRTFRARCSASATTLVSREASLVVSGRFLSSDACDKELQGPARPSETCRDQVSWPAMQQWRFSLLSHSLAFALSALDCSYFSLSLTALSCFIVLTGLILKNGNTENK